MAVYSGDDGTAYELILLGAKGNISVTANVAPKAMSAVCEAALAGNAELAKTLNAPLTALHHDLFVESNPIPVKWALVYMGRMEAGIRLPLTPLAENCHNTVINALQQAGI